jgi:hypothetical protein
LLLFNPDYGVFQWLKAVWCPAIARLGPNKGTTFADAIWTIAAVQPTTPFGPAAISSDLHDWQDIIEVHPVTLQFFFIQGSEQKAARNGGLAIFLTKVGRNRLTFGPPNRLTQSGHARLAFHYVPH